jgi:hypothetical protein
MSYTFEFQDGPMGVQIGHDCNIEEIDKNEQAFKCKDLEVNDIVVQVNGTAIPEPKTIDQLRELIATAGRPMTLTFEKPIEEDVAALVKKVSAARRELKSLRETLDASSTAGTNDATVQQLTKLLSDKEKLIKDLEKKLDQLGFERELEEEDSNNIDNNNKLTNDDEEILTNTLIIKKKLPADNGGSGSGANKKNKKKRSKSSFRKFATIIGRAFGKPKKKDSEEKNETTTPSVDNEMKATNRAALEEKKKGLQFEMINSVNDDEKEKLRQEVKNIEDQLLNNQEVVTSFDDGNTNKWDQESISGENVLNTGSLDPSSSMKWDEEKVGLSTIMEDDNQSYGNLRKNNLEMSTNMNDAKRLPIGQRKFGDVSKSMFDPIDYRSLEEDVYELYEQQLLIAGRQSSMSIVSTDNERDGNQEAIRSTIKFYGKPLLVLFRAYANSAGINRAGNNATFDKHSELTKQVNVAAFMMMCTDFGLCTKRRDSNMNGRAGGGWVEPTIVDWVSMSDERLSTAGVKVGDLETDETGNPIPPSVDPPVLSTRGYLPITKDEIKKIFRKVSGSRNQFKYVKKVGFLWILLEIIKKSWPRLHADQINFEREMHSRTALTCFRRVATKHVRGKYELKYKSQYRILKYNGAIAYQLWSNRQQRQFADDEFNNKYKILAVVSKDWVPLKREEDTDGMYDFGEGYEPMILKKGTVLRLKEGMYNDSEYDSNDPPSSKKKSSSEFPDDAYFSPLRRTIDLNTGTVSTGMEADDVDSEGVKVFYGQETTAGASTGIFPANCVDILRIEYIFRSDLVKDAAIVRIQSLGRGYSFRQVRARQWDAATAIQKYVRGQLSRLWWNRAKQVRTCRAEYNVSTLLDAVPIEDRLSTLLHRMGLESFSSAVSMTSKKSERGFRFAQGNATLPSSNKSHRITLSVPNWMKDKSNVIGSRNQVPEKLPRRQVSDARYQKKLDDHNTINVRTYQEPRINDEGMLDNVINEFDVGLHMLYHAYSSQIGMNRTVHDKRFEGTFAAVDKNKRTLSFGEFGRICSDFKLFAPVYFRDAKMATLKRAMEVVWKYDEEAQDHKGEQSEEEILRFTDDGALPVDRKLLKPLFNIEALRSANGINASLPRLHSHLDLGYALADIAMAAASNMVVPGGLHATSETVMGYNIGGGKNVERDWMGGEQDDAGGVIGHFNNDGSGNDGSSLDRGRNEQVEDEAKNNKDDEEADPMEIKIRVLFAMFANGEGKVELVQLCEALADSEDADELLRGNDQWKFPEFEGEKEEELLATFMTIDQTLSQFRVSKNGVDTGGSGKNATEEFNAKMGGADPRPGYRGSKAEICKALFLRLRLDDHHVLDKILQGNGRGMTFFTGRIGDDTKYVHSESLTYNASGATHPIQKLRVAMHTIIQRGAKVHSLLQSYDKHAYGAVSGVLRIATLYDAITVMIERKLLEKNVWKMNIAPFLLKQFGTVEQEANVHKLYPTEDGVEYGRFIEWCGLPLPDYHNNPDADLPEKPKSYRGGPLLGKFLVISQNIKL